MSIIIGRKHELEELDRLYRSDRPEFLAVYGRRRVGKTYNQFPILVSLLKNALQRVTHGCCTIIRCCDDGNFHYPTDSIATFFMPNIG